MFHVEESRDARRRSRDSGLLPRPSLVRPLQPCHDSYLASFRSLRLDGFLLAPARGPWKVTRRRLGSCLLEHGVHPAPFVATGSTARGCVTFAFAAEPDSGLRIQEHEVSRDVICRWPGGAAVSLAALRPSGWFVLTVADSDPAALEPGTAASGSDSGPTQRVLHQVRPGDLDRLRARARHVLESAGGLDSAGQVPERPAPDEQALLVDLVRATTGPPHPVHGDGSPRIERHPVLEKIRDLFAARSAEPVYVADLCAATGLAERTLRHIVTEQFGLSPMRLLRCRRLCQLRRYLQRDDDGSEGLAQIAGRHGFWHMGSLAWDYRTLFGELPSETRRRFAGSAPRAASLTTAGSLVASNRGEDLVLTLAGGRSSVQAPRPVSDSGP